MVTYTVPSGLKSAIPFWLSLSTLPVFILSVYLGGWWLLMTYLYSWVLVGALDNFVEQYRENINPNTEDSKLKWYRIITLIWFPIQFLVIYICIAIVSSSVEYSLLEKIMIMFSVGILSGTIGIVYAHELMHQKPIYERHLADALMCIVLYGHFRSEHLLVHHLYVGTPKDSVTARYNEGFHRFFIRVLYGSIKSSWTAEKKMRARKKQMVWHISNPFWKYASLQIIFLAIAFAIGGWIGIGFFIVQAFTAIWQLELVNYVEHYGLTREYLGNNKYEHTKPHHSWNAAHRITNYFLINLQRHSDHHYKPSRRFPLLQNYDESEAPQLPRSYPMMTFLAMIPPVWRHVMNPKVRAWRRQFYSHITDWNKYNKALNPWPK